MEKKVKLRSKCSISLGKGDIVIIRTPGGGGYGSPEERDADKIRDDILDEKYSVKFLQKTLKLNCEGLG